MDRIAKLAATTMDVTATLAEKTKDLSMEAVERTGGALAEAKEYSKEVEARADAAILTAADKVGLRGSMARDDSSPGSGGESNDITEQGGEQGGQQYSPPVVESEARSSFARFGGGLASATEAAGDLGRTSMSMLRREPSPEPPPAASGGYSTRSWSSRAADADAPLGGGGGGGSGGRRDSHSDGMDLPEPTNSPPRGGGGGQEKPKAWWKPKGEPEPEMEPAGDEEDEEYGERKGLLSGVGDSVSGLGSAAAGKARAAGQKIGVVEKPPETLLEQVQSELPSLKKKTRVKGFAACFSMGCCLMMLSTIFIPTMMLNPGPFARTYSAGNLAMLTGTFCIVGPRRQCKSCFQTKRIITSIVFLASLVATLYFAFKGESILCLITVCVQAAALVYYVASYVPYARKLLRVSCKKCMNRYT